MAAACKDLTTCSLCLGEFQDPRALPCLHTFCLNCLVQHCNSNQRNARVKCPECREQHDVPKSGVEGFRQDFRIKSFMEMETDKRNKQEEKLDQLNMMKRSIELNGELLQFGKTTFEDGTSEMLNRVPKLMKRYHDWLDQMEKKIIEDIHCNAAAERDRLGWNENNLAKASASVNSLKAILVQNNTDGDFDTEFDRLHEFLTDWVLNYGLPYVDLAALESQFFRNVNNFSVVKMTQEAVEGVPVKPIVSKKILCQDPLVLLRHDN